MNDFLPHRIVITDEANSDLRHFEQVFIGILIFNFVLLRLQLQLLNVVLKTQNYQHLANDPPSFVSHVDSFLLDGCLHVVEDYLVACAPLELGLCLVQLHHHLDLVALYRQLIAKGLFFLETDVEDELLREGMLVIQMFVHDGRLVDLESGGRYAILEGVLWRRLDDVDEGNSICDLYLNRNDSVLGRVRHLPQHYGLSALLDGKIARPPPEVHLIVQGQLYQFWLVFVLPEKWHSIVRLQRNGVAGLHLAYLYQELGCVGQHVQRSDLDDSSELVDMLVFNG